MTSNPLNDPADDPMGRLPAFNRVSIRAVLSDEGEDHSAALAEAGFVDPVSIRVVLGDEPDVSGGILGDGLTSNLTAVLEIQQADDVAWLPNADPGTVHAASNTAQSSGPVTTTLPAAYGVRPLAPVRR